MDGLLLFAHGARDARWATPFRQVAERVQAARPGTPVVLAFLEFMSPGLVDAGDTLVAQGCTAVRVLPLFLGSGGHVRKDVPELLAQLEAKHPQVRWHLLPAVGENDTLIAAMAQIADDALPPSTSRTA